MTAPNLKNPTSIVGFTTIVGISTTDMVGIVTNLSDSNSSYKINCIFAANVDGSSAVDISVSILRNSIDGYIAKTIAVPADATQVISTKETYFYLEEGDELRAQASSANDIDITVSGEIIYQGIL